MKKEFKIIAGSMVVGFTIIAALGFVAGQKAHAPDHNNNQQQTQQDQNDEPNQPVAFDKTKYSTDDANSLWLVANKKRPISLDYVPEDLVDVNVNKRTDKSAQELMLRQEAATAMEELFAAAKAEGLDLLLGSAYRSADLQATYYNNYVEAYGQEQADTFSAKPGTSEHQIGLSADLSRDDQQCYLETCFGQTEEGQWIAANAHKYGFIIRYLEGKEAITGYQYEPWHVRYVGKELAAEVYASGQTLEEFFGLN